MRAEEQAQQAEAQITMFELLRSPTLRMPLTIAIMMQLSQQLSGINAVFYYSTNLFITTGLSETSAKYATIGIGSVMVLMTLVSIPLMDRSGRRTLHLYGLGGMFIFSIFITISFLVKELVSWIWWLSVVSTLFYVVFFAVGPGSIPWMITAELFSQGPRWRLLPSTPAPLHPLSPSCTLGSITKKIENYNPPYFCLSYRNKHKYLSARPLQLV